MMEQEEIHSNDEFDVPWKEIIESYFPDLLLFFLPVAHDGIDWGRGFEFLDKELSRITRESLIGDRRMDKLVKVWRRDGVELWLLIHIEVQGNRKKNFELGMYVYQYRAFDLYQVPVVGLAILADEDEHWRPTEFSYDIWGVKQYYRFISVKLLDYSEAALEQSNNPFAMVTLAHLHAKRTKHRTEDRYQAKWNLIRQLYQNGFNRQQVIDLFCFIDWVLHLPDEADKRLWKEIADFEERKKMPYISSVERIGQQIGQRIGQQIGQRIGEGIGEKRGIQIGEAKILMRQLQHRFGPVPDWANEKIAKAEPLSLEAWSLRFVNAQSLDEVFSDKV
ncbi:MAG: cytosolic protein [Magnetococcales bacterium]|nr:cytosolic protein [Magnetococcales bacterium]